MTRPFQSRPGRLSGQKQKGTGNRFTVPGSVPGRMNPLLAVVVGIPVLWHLAIVAGTYYDAGGWG